MQNRETGIRFILPCLNFFWAAFSKQGEKNEPRYFKFTNK